MRTTDVDLHGHVNNAAYWHAIEQRLPRSGVDPRRPLRALLDYRRPIDLTDEIDLVDFSEDGRANLAFVALGVAKAVARLEPAG